MTGKDRRQLKASIEQHRAQNPPAPVLTREPPPKWPSAPVGRPAVQREDLPAEHLPDAKSEHRPLSVEYIALRLQEAVIRREGRNALDPGVTLDCLSAARLLLKETRR